MPIIRVGSSVKYEFIITMASDEKYLILMPLSPSKTNLTEFIVKLPPSLIT
jgi:hypothetical protein